MNLKPFHAEYKPDGGGFILEFWCATEGNKRVRVRLKFDFWWISFLAREMWKAIEHRYNETCQAKDAMKGPVPK